MPDNSLLFVEMQFAASIENRQHDGKHAAVGRRTGPRCASDTGGRTLSSACIRLWQARLRVAEADLMREASRIILETKPSGA
jgi:hypothetical protein